MVLKAKGLNYRTIEITPGLGQLSIFKISGQKKVPVLVDNDHTVFDSSEIVRYLEQKTPQPNLIPTQSREAAQVHLIEDWADTTLAKAARGALVEAAVIDKELRVALLPEELPSSIRQLVGDLPFEMIRRAQELVPKTDRDDLVKSLIQISNLLKSNQWLVGDKLSIADIAVAAQLSLIRFPISSGTSLCGKGCPGLKDNPLLQGLFEWRDELEQKLDNSEFSNSL